MNFLHASLAAVIVLALTAQSWRAPLSLHDCLNQARDNNPALKSAAWESRLAEENVRRAKAGTYPRIDATAGYTKQLEPQAVKLGGVTAETQEPDFASGGIAATYTIYDFGRRNARIGQAEA